MNMMNVILDDSEFCNFYLCQVKRYLMHNRNYTI